MPFPYGVHLVTDTRRLGGRDLVSVARQAVAGGIAAIHLREPGLPGTELWRLGISLRILTCLSLPCALVVNDRVDVALAVEADAVQLGRRSLSATMARTVAPDRFRGEGRLLIGCSVHSVEEAVAAEGEGADYVLLGTIYASASHPDIAPAGPGLVRQVREAVRLPIVAIGGITAENAGEVLEAGADGIAVIGAILDAADVKEATRRLVEAVQRM
jgi:thiamine-phosphate diphosphorylase